MFIERLISSVILMAITIAVLIIGDNVLFGTILIISLIGLYELYKILGFQNKVLGITGYLAAILYHVFIYFHAETYVLPFIIAFLMGIMFVYVFSYPKYHSSQITMAYFGFFYVAVMLNFIYRVRMLENGIFLVWLIFIGAWGSDTCAYCVGVLIGKHKMSPKLSPKKSIEGAMGGVIGAGLLGYLFGAFFHNQLPGINNPKLLFMIVGSASSVLSQIGDLGASAIKRNHDIKDYGKLIKGHGGILDRFDSIIFTAPLVYYLILYLR